MAVKTTKFSVIEGSCFVCMARITGADGAAITQGTVDTITVTIRDTHNEADTLGPDEELTIGDVVYDTLQTGLPWTKDQTGYNFRYTVPHTAAPTASNRLDVMFTVTMVNADVLKVPFRGQVEDDPTAESD